MGSAFGTGARTPPGPCYPNTIYCLWMVGLHQTCSCLCSVKGLARDSGCHSHMQSCSFAKFGPRGLNGGPGGRSWRGEIKGAAACCTLPWEPLAAVATSDGAWTVGSASEPRNGPEGAGPVRGWRGSAERVNLGPRRLAGCLQNWG